MTIRKERLYCTVQGPAYDNRPNSIVGDSYTLIGRRASKVECRKVMVQWCPDNEIFILYDDVQVVIYVD